jgi:nuclear GTP-binding protein
MIIDPEGAQSIRCGAISKKGQWREVKKVVDLSDVILQVIDARDPISGRCAEIEAVVKEHGKKIIYILNKVDLVPNAKEWVNYFKAEN